VTSRREFISRPFGAKEVSIIPSNSKYQSFYIVYGPKYVC
jgi:hypothetical protein